MLLFALSMFDVRYIQNAVVTLRNGGFNGTVVVVVLVVSRVITVSSDLAIVVDFVLTGTAAVLVAVSSGVLSKSVA